MIPVGQWGAHDLLYPYAKKPHLFPRTQITMKVGDPVPLDDLRDEAAHDARSSTRRRVGSWRRSPTWWPSSATRRRRPSGSTPAGRAYGQTGNPKQDGEEVEGRMTQVSVLGAGSWGTAFSLVLADAGNDVTLWARREEVCDTINQRRENTDYLPGVELPPTVTATHDTEKALAGADVVVFAVPSQTFRTNLEQWAPHIPDVGGDGVADEGRRARHPQADE